MSEAISEATAACNTERSNALAGCPSIVSAALESGPISGFTSSLSCAQLVAAYEGCKETAVQRLDFADRCEADGGIPTASARPNEYWCNEP